MCPAVASKGLSTQSLILHKEQNRDFLWSLHCAPRGHNRCAGGGAAVICTHSRWNFATIIIKQTDLMNVLRRFNCVVFVASEGRVGAASGMQPAQPFVARIAQCARATFNTRPCSCVYQDHVIVHDLTRYCFCELFWSVHLDLFLEDLKLLLCLRLRRSLVQVISPLIYEWTSIIQSWIVLVPIQNFISNNFFLNIVFIFWRLFIIKYFAVFNWLIS